MVRDDTTGESARDVLGRSEVSFGRFRALKVAIKEGKSLRVSGERKKRREKAFLLVLLQTIVESKFGV